MKTACIFFAIASHIFLWSEEGEVQSLIERFESYAEAQRKEWNVQGMAIAIIKGDEVLLSKGYGQRGIDDKRAVDENTLFQIGSLAKSFTSALTAIEVDRGTMKWEDDVIAHLPDFHLKDPWASAQFQIQDLYAQRSGLPPYAGDLQALLGYSAKEMVENARFLIPISSFRSQYAYQNIFFLMGGRLLEDKHKKSYAELLKKEIFTPLGMNDSSVTLKEYLASSNRAEWLMHRKDGTIYRLKDDFPQADWSYVYAPAGGINSTVKDMSNWMIFQANRGKFKDKQIISAENMRRMTRAMIFAGEMEPGRGLYYALGWVRMDDSPYPLIWHDGSTLGVYNFAAFIPEEKLGIVILTNGRNTQLALGLGFQFFDMYFKRPDQDWGRKLLAQSKKAADKPEFAVDKPTSALPLPSYTGEYENPIFGPAIVLEKNGELQLLLGKNRATFSLKHWDRDIFTFSWHPIEEDEIKVFFNQGDDGKIASMEVSLIENEGAGIFKRKVDQNSDKGTVRSGG